MTAQSGVCIVYESVCGVCVIPPLDCRIINLGVTRFCHVTERELKHGGTMYNPMISVLVVLELVFCL